ncbi:RagB/SusD family nutrient uptake outer membrane protein [Flavobacterium sp. Sd200]|uniref:RagB/SusD family nutrient uptake outer membrane protein n=1 Tax=Flavobacterium sp. Sd200 TaxID=2692211 RepID=UPI00136F2CE1|nr:RagB/SusD family nutrient uptake outer membrane protein [Flavobacterium sp. Sd200]MXN91900.1 RagB/SusD family nutrient uptake outer membrane protein [Flavobacterium sp. Sd200]
MKKSFIYLTVAASLLSVGCSDDFLDPQRDTSVISTRDIAEFSPDNPDLIIGTLEGIYSYMMNDRSITTQHFEFGQKGIDIWTDMVSGDMALKGSGYGWYDNTANLLVTTDYTRLENRIIWQYYYKVISSANEVIASVGGNDASPEDETIRYTLGQAKALRAYGYFYLAQLLQRGYDANQPILPFIDGDVNIPSKVPASRIYESIVGDLNSAITLLDGYNRDAKHKVNKSVAQGLLAYTYAAMGDYQNARLMADAVITTGGFPLTTRAQSAYPGAGSGFNDAATASWMWGYDITEAMGQQLINWWGQMDYYTYSYQSAGDYKVIDDALYAQIPANDIRKSQFSTTAGDTYLMPLNKFFDPARQFQQQYIISTDYIYMRVDEMYLLSAEAAAKSGDEAAAKARLVELLSLRYATAAQAQDYANPLSGQALQDAIYLQTRIEFWGEGKTYLALKRNRATITRGTNHLFRAGQTFSYNQDELSFQIPQLEMNNNPAITEQN